MQQNRLDNKGSAIVTVIVVVTFITVLGTTMLYIAGQNYQQKQTDYQNKQSFYKAEEALDSLKALLVQDVERAYKAAYEDTSMNFIKLSSMNSRINHYQNAYTENLKKLWDARLSEITDDGTKTYKERLAEAVRAYMTTEDRKLADVAKCIYSVDGYGVESDSSDGAKNQFVIKGVRAKYTSGSYTTFLYTDIAITIPDYGRTIVENSTTTDIDSSNVRIVALTDYVVYMNWRRADYDETTKE